MGRHATALQLQPTDGLGGLAGWAGVVLLGLAVIVRLLDWGPLSQHPPTRLPPRRVARILAMVGAGLVAMGLGVGLLG